MTHLDKNRMLGLLGSSSFTLQLSTLHVTCHPKSALLYLFSATLRLSKFLNPMIFLSHSFFPYIIALLPEFSNCSPLDVDRNSLFFLH